MAKTPGFLSVALILSLVAFAVTFQNPGGKWMPAQLAEEANVKTLKELGLKVDPRDLSDATGPILGAVVSLEGCSGSFVSPEGLVVTNYHCVKRCLEKNSNAENNLMEKGFLAKDRGDERPCQAGQRVYVTLEQTEVTEKMLSGIESIPDPKDRIAEIELRQNAILKDCEKSGDRCELKSFFEGAQFFLIRKNEISDIRLVYAPSRQVGKFGGEIDNWEWPRHTGDFGYFRAYVKKDGKSAPFDPNEEHGFAYRNKQRYLKLPSSPLAPGDPRSPRRLPWQNPAAGHCAGIGRIRRLDGPPKHFHPPAMDYEPKGIDKRRPISDVQTSGLGI